MVIYYLMRSQGLTLKQAYSYVKYNRPATFPNRSFMLQLIEAEKRLYPHMTQPSILPSEVRTIHCYVILLFTLCCFVLVVYHHLLSISPLFYPILHYRFFCKPHMFVSCIIPSCVVFSCLYFTVMCRWVRSADCYLNIAL